MGKPPFWTRGEVLEALVVLDEEAGTHAAAKLVCGQEQWLQDAYLYVFEKARIEKADIEFFFRRYPERKTDETHVIQVMYRIHCARIYWLRQALHILRYEAEHGRTR